MRYASSLIIICVGLTNILMGALSNRDDGELGKPDDTYSPTSRIVAKRSVHTCANLGYKSNLTRITYKVGTMLDYDVLCGDPANCA